jgi:inositol phosphorylceramide mannosyltransferase catalytic subunit
VLIPRVFHQIWVGPNPFPEELVGYQETWLRHNPGWELRLWTEENLPEGLRRPEIYERLRVPAERADMLRLEVVWMFGGVYMDADFECLRPIEPLIEDADFFAGYRKPGRVNNALFGAVAGHPLLARAIRELRPRETYGPVDKEGTGPRFLNRLVNESPEVTIFAPGFFYPRTPEARRSAYAYHHRARSWHPTESLQGKLVEAERRLREAQDEALEWRLRCEQAEAELAQLKNGFSPLLRLRELLVRR